MKLRLLAMGVVATFIMASCGSENGQKAEVTEEKQVEEVAEATTYMVDAENSSLEWTGKEFSGTKHNGIIKIKSGEILVKDSAIQPGSKFIIDMNSISDLDLKDEESKAKLEGHLKSPDFFATDSFPEGTFEITSITPNEDGSSKIAGNLTLRGITKNIEFNGTVMMKDNAIIASAKDVIFDRTKFNVNFRNEGWLGNVEGLVKDKIINHDIKLDFMVMAKK